VFVRACVCAFVHVCIAEGDLVLNVDSVVVQK